MLLQVAGQQREQMQRRALALADAGRRLHLARLREHVLGVVPAPVMDGRVRLDV
jgi:hypothetical protein